MGHALCSPCTASSIKGSTAKAQREDRVRGATLHGAARLSRSREKAPRNPDLRPRPECESAGQARVPYAGDAPTSVSMVAGEIAEPGIPRLRGQRPPDPSQRPYRFGVTQGLLCTVTDFAPLGLRSGQIARKTVPPWRCHCGRCRTRRRGTRGTEFHGSRCTKNARTMADYGR